MLINCGRGGLLDLDAALAALESGGAPGRPRRVRARAPAHHPIFDHPASLTPPHGADPGNELTFADAAQGVVDVLAGRKPAAVANPDWVRAAGVPA